MMKERNLSIELLKFLAVLIVLNSHMDPIYGKFGYLSTGGAIGDALFFFVSGFTIFLGRFGRFDNWYKRRIKRIYPSLIVWTAVISFVGVKQISVSKAVIGGGYWFVSCIMLYYVVLWFVRRFAEHKPLIPFVLCCIGVIIWYCFLDLRDFALYGNNYFRWMFFFLFMLAGAYIGNGTIRLKTKSWIDAIMMIASILLFYGMQFLGDRYPIMMQLQILTLVPLMGVVIYLYKFCSSDGVVRIMHTRGGQFIKFIAGLCLEAYVVQVTLIPLLAKQLTFAIPLNLFITSVIVITVAYLARCLGRVFSQVFEDENMNWKKVFELVG